LFFVSVKVEFEKNFRSICLQTTLSRCSRYLFLRVTLIFDWAGGAFSQGGKKFAAQISLLLNLKYFNHYKK